MKTTKPPVIDKDLESKAFRVFLRLIDSDSYRDVNPSTVALMSIEFAEDFNTAWSLRHEPRPIGLHSMPSDEVMEEYHPGAEMIGVPEIIFPHSNELLD